MRLLLALIFLVLAVGTVQGIEHSRLSRGIDCEIQYIQGRVDTARTLNDLIKLYDSKKDAAIIEYLERVKNYQLYVAELDGEKNCVNIDHTFVEIAYLRMKTMLLGSEQNNDKGQRQ